jgi:hypothetical protein
MYDRPNLAELISAVRFHLENELVPLTKEINHKLYFQTLVATNVLRVAEREARLGQAHFKAEWSRLNMLLGDEVLPSDSTQWQSALQARNQRLCEEIRQGKHDDNQALFSHLKACATEQLEVANPKFLASLT